MGKLKTIRDQLMHDPEFRAGYEQQTPLVRFGQMMRAARENQELTQTQLADKLGVSQSEVSRLEKGEGVNGPTLERIVAFAHALGLRLVVGLSENSEDPTTAKPQPRMLRTRLRSPSHHNEGMHEERQTNAFFDERQALWRAF